MTDIILTGSKYLIIILFAYFTYISFRAQRDVPDERKKLAYALQTITMLLIHALAFLSICIHITLDDAIEMTLSQALGLYAGQFVYLVVLSCVIPRFAALSRGLNNVMCMFLTIGFIIQTRLDFDVALRQSLIVAAGTVVFLICVFLCKRAKFMRNLNWLYAILGMALLGLVLILSRVVSGAKLALDLGFFSFQPSEFVKIIFVLFVASAFQRSNSRKTVLFTAAVAAIHVLILVFCHDLGSALILFMIYVLMLYAATKKLLYVGIGAAGLAVASVAAYHLFGHVRTRVTAWLDPWSIIDGSGYQIAQALFAIGTGGWFGSGLFGGKPKSVPVVSNDMVFSAISEELGGLFSLLLIMLCFCFVLMIFRVAMRVNNPFYKLLAFGLGAAYGFQVFLTIGGTIKFIPLTGVNLPFISNGGSSLLTSLIMLGMIQALYVISEADVEREREMVAAGMPIQAFDGYEEKHPVRVSEERIREEERRREEEYRREEAHRREDDHRREEAYRREGDYRREEAYRHEGDYRREDGYPPEGIPREVLSEKELRRRERMLRRQKDRVQQVGIEEEPELGPLIGFEDTRRMPERSEWDPEEEEPVSRRGKVREVTPPRSQRDRIQEVDDDEF